MKRLPTVFIAVLLLALFLTGCSGIPAPPAAPIENEEAVDVAVEATLTAIAQSESEEGEAAPTSQPDTKTPETPDEAEPVSVSTPEPSEDISPSGLVLPPSVTDFAPAPRPASSKGDPDAPVVIYEWSDYT